MRKKIRPFLLVLISFPFFVFAQVPIGKDYLKTERQLRLVQLNEFFQKPLKSYAPKTQLCLRLENVLLYPADYMFGMENKKNWEIFEKKLREEQKEELYIQRSYYLRDFRFPDYLSQWKKELGRVILYSIPYPEIKNVGKYLEEMKKYLNYRGIPYDEIILRKDAPSLEGFFIDEEKNVHPAKGIGLKEEKIEFLYKLEKKHIEYQKKLFLQENIWMNDHEVMNFFDKSKKEKHHGKTKTF